jgi:hypothetical protein
MPFLPIVLIVAWQAVSKSASFALGWATALYFGQVPGRQGRVLSVISLLAAAWVVLVTGFAIPILGGALLESLGVIERNFDVRPVLYVALVAGLVLTPPFVAAAVVFGEFHEKRSVGTWLRLLPASYPATLMLGLSVIQMVLVTPVLLFQRWRQKRKLVQVPLVMREGTDDDDLLEAVRTAARAAGIDEARVERATGPKTWPMRTVAFAAKHLLGAIVRGEPVRLATDGIEIYAYATNIAILGPKEDAYRLRAAVERELAFSDAYLTWNEEAQGFERELMEAHAAADHDVPALERRLDEIQRRMDVASLNSEEWNVLYRLRLQVEQRAHRGVGAH